MNRALTDLLRAHARGRPGVTLDSLRRQFADDRLLTRIFTGPDAKRWILNGATSHNRMVLSALPVARVRPSGLNATAMTESVWAASGGWTRRRCPWWLGPCGGRKSVASGRQ
jgi:hypothetical protein